MATSPIELFLSIHHSVAGRVIEDVKNNDKAVISVSLTRKQLCEIYEAKFIRMVTIKYLVKMFIEHGYVDVCFDYDRNVLHFTYIDRTLVRNFHSIAKLEKNLSVQKE